MAGKKYTEEQKDEFFRILDRGGTVRAAARAVGVNENAGYNWLRKTGLTMERAAPRIYPPELKTEFLRLVVERQIISAVAVELGIHRPTAYAWARKAGISTSEARRVNLRRDEFLRLRASGLTRAQARAAVSADARSATDWVSACDPLGIRLANFRGPTEDELAHDYLWRAHQQVPQKGVRSLGT